MLAERLKNLRKGQHLSQMALSKIIGVSQQTIGSWETGRTSPDNSMITTLAKHFNVTTDYLLGHIPATVNTTVTGDNNSTATTGTISNSTINGTINTGTINGNIITPSATENDTCQMYHALSAEAKGQIDNLVKMLHDMENKK